MQEDYRNLYNAYWLRPDRVGECSTEMRSIAGEITKNCGFEKTLDVGSGEGHLVLALLENGVDTYGVDVSEVVVERANTRAPERFIQGSALSLPFEDDSFPTVVSVDFLEHLAPDDVETVLREIYRVCGRYVYLQVATTHDRDNHWHLTVERRNWWESQCFQAGFRKHPKYYQVNDYEGLNNDGWQICILLEKIPQSVTNQYPLSVLEQSSDLHMDMLRRTGERSDAHVIRYHWACSYLKTGDRVLDAACGLGYGSWLVSNLTRASEINGIDGSEPAIAYAKSAYICEPLKFAIGFLPDALRKTPDAYFDSVLSFETLEHVENPEELLSEFHRILTPGGRICVSVPNDWSDESGEDPNPHHLHVYDWKKLKEQIGDRFIIEQAFGLTASQHKLTSEAHTWKKSARILREFDSSSATAPECEWILLVAMKNPSEICNANYEERCYPNLTQTGSTVGNYSSGYSNPWIFHAFVNGEYRLRNRVALSSLCMDMLERSNEQSNDYAACLYVLCDDALAANERKALEIDRLLTLVNAWVRPNPNSPEQFRWLISLTFIKGKLLMSVGKFEEALAAFLQCGDFDVLQHSVQFAAIFTEAWFLAGKIAFAFGRPEEAKTHWKAGVGLGGKLLSMDAKEILLNGNWPNSSNVGNGVREYIVAWDHISQCANGLNALESAGGTCRVDMGLLPSFQNEIQEREADLRKFRSELNSCRANAAGQAALLKQQDELLSEPARRAVPRIIKRALKRRFGK